MSMKAARRLRTFTLWTGTLLCVLIAAAFVVSAFWWVVIQVPTSRGMAMFLVAGSVMFETHEVQSAPVLAHAHSWGLVQWNAVLAEAGHDANP